MARLAIYRCDECDRTWHVREEYDSDLQEWFPEHEESATCYRCDQEAERDEAVSD